MELEHNIAALTAETILEDEILTAVFDEDDEVYRARMLLTLVDRAKELGVKGKFESLAKAYGKQRKAYDQQHKEVQSKPQGTLNSYTEFSYGDTEQEYFCGNWIATENGIKTFTMYGEQLACYHPILPVQRLINAETGKEKVCLAFKKGGIWKEIIVDKGVIASNTKIVSLAEYGVSVTSETSRALVRFLADIENYNINLIDKQTSTSKLGWIGNEFMPYGQDVVFDSDDRYRDIFRSVTEDGSYKVWLDLIKQIRAGPRREPLIYMAGSFASILLKPLNILSFILNLWGETGKGKTVALMLAVSIWGDPAEGKYMTDSTASRVALEVRQDILNNLPMAVDDLSKMRDKYGDEFTEIIYMLCAGKGKDRSNVNLGLNKPTTWTNIILTNIERPLANETMKGGAINRILDFEMEEGTIFEDGNAVVEIITRNYGFAGRLFVDAVQEIGFDTIRDLQQGYFQQIKDRAAELGIEKEEKQMIPLSAMLVADKIATDYIFKDGVYMDFDHCFDTLKNKGEVSEHERAYEFIMSEVSVNINKFKPDASGEYRGEVWGVIERGYIVIIKNAFDRLCDRGNFSAKAFLSWAAKRDYIVTQAGKNTKVTKIGGASSRCVWLKVRDDLDGSNDFIDFDIEINQEELPFVD